MDPAVALPPLPEAHLRRHLPDEPVLFLAPGALAATHRRFVAGFPGLVTYAVKANPAPEVLETLIAGGMRAFDVASPDEIALVRRLCPGAVLHYHNPVRSTAEIDLAVRAGVRSYAVDCAGQLGRLARRHPAPGTAEVAVRFALPLKGAAYDFGDKFGATEAEAARLLAAAAASGFVPALTFHPGTQCTRAETWEGYIAAAARIAERAGIRPRRLNVGGGFPSARDGHDHDLERIFRAIARAVRAHFGPGAPALVCEPGRALVADCAVLAARIKAVRGGDLFLNDGIYGGLCEQGQLGPTRRIRIVTADGRPLPAGRRRWRVFGPTCDSLDRLPGRLVLPAAVAEGDYALFHSLGAYSLATATRFNGYGRIALVTVGALEPGAAGGQVAAGSASCSRAT